MLYDIDGDGLISFNELLAHQTAVFKMLYVTKPNLYKKVGETAENLAMVTTESIF